MRCCFCASAAGAHTGPMGPVAAATTGHASAGPGGRVKTGAGAITADTGITATFTAATSGGGGGGGGARGFEAVREKVRRRNDPAESAVLGGALGGTLGVGEGEGGADPRRSGVYIEDADGAEFKHQAGFPHMHSLSSLPWGCVPMSIHSFTRESPVRSERPLMRGSAQHLLY